VDFLLVVIEDFSLGITAEALRANMDWKLPFLNGVTIWSKISGRWRHPPRTILRVAKLDISIFLVG